MDGQYPGLASAPDAAHAKAMTVWFDLLADTRYWELEPYFDVDGGRAVALEDTEYLVYIEKPGPLELTVEKHGYDVFWIDPATGESTRGKKFSGEHFTGAPPDKSHDWMLHVVREGRVAGMNKSYKFESREIVPAGSRVEQRQSAVRDRSAQDASSRFRRPLPYAAKITRETRATRSMLWLWMGDVAADHQGYRVIATGQKGRNEGARRYREELPRHHAPAPLRDECQRQGIRGRQRARREPVSPLILAVDTTHELRQHCAWRAETRCWRRSRCMPRKVSRRSSTGALRALLARHRVAVARCRSLRGGLGTGLVYGRARRAGVRQGIGRSAPQSRRSAISNLEASASSVRPAYAPRCSTRAAAICTALSTMPRGGLVVPEMVAKLPVWLAALPQGVEFVSNDFTAFGDRPPEAPRVTAPRELAASRRAGSPRRREPRIPPSSTPITSGAPTPRWPGKTAAAESWPRDYCVTFTTKYVNSLPGSSFTWCGIFAGIVTTSPGGQFFSMPAADRGPRISWGCVVLPSDHRAAVDQRRGAALHEEDVGLRLVPLGLAGAFAMGDHERVIAVSAERLGRDFLRVDFGRQALGEAFQLRGGPKVEAGRVAGRQRESGEQECGQERFMLHDSLSNRDVHRRAGCAVHPDHQRNLARAERLVHRRSGSGTRPAPSGVICWIVMSIPRYVTLRRAGIGDYRGSRPVTTHLEHVARAAELPPSGSIRRACSLR